MHHNLALLRRFAVNALNRAGSNKQSLRQKSKRAAMDDCYAAGVGSIAGRNEAKILAVNSFLRCAYPATFTSQMGLDLSSFIDDGDHIVDKHMTRRSSEEKHQA